MLLLQHVVQSARQPEPQTPDVPAWFICVRSYVCVHIWTTIYGRPYMDDHIWTTIYGRPYMDIHIWTSIYGRCYFARRWRAHVGRYRHAGRYEHVKPPQQLVRRLHRAVAVKHKVREPQQIDIFQIEPVCEHTESVVDLSRTFQVGLHKKLTADDNPLVSFEHQHSLQGGGLVEALAASAELVLWRVPGGIRFS